MTIRPMVLARDLAIVCFCVAVFIALVSLNYDRTDAALAAYDRASPSNLNMGKILATGSILREYKEIRTPKNLRRDIDNREIKWWMAKITNYNECFDRQYFDDIVACVDTIPERDVALVRLAMTNPESFVVTTR